MKWRGLLGLLGCLILAMSVQAEQVVERQGRYVLSFSMPGMELRGQKDGRTTRVTYGQYQGQGEIKINVVVRDFLDSSRLETVFREERLRARASGTSRLKESVEIPGASKVLVYSSTDPFDAEVVVLYGRDYRCQLTVTGRGVPFSEVKAAYERLVVTLSMRAPSIVSPIRIESDSSQTVEVPGPPDAVEIRGLPRASDTP